MPLLKLLRAMFVFAGVLSLVCLSITGCGGGSATTPPPPPQISVTLSTAPPASLTAEGTASIVATVANDSANAGVNWTCMPAGSCGSFNPAQTASGAATTYTAPAAAGSVTIIATSVTQSTATASAMVSITATQAKIAIALGDTPPATLAPGGTANVSANVTNDPANEGVDWSCAPAGSCGAFNPAHTASGADTTYTAPAAAGNVTITAACTASPSTSVSVNVTIQAGSGGNTLAGNFVFYARGEESSSHLYSLAGAATFNSNGTITAGEQDFNDGVAANQSPAAGDQITAGTYELDSDGRGTMTLTTNNTHLGNAGVETFHVVMVNPNHLLIEQFDGTATSSGSLDLQTPEPGLAALDAVYAFTVAGRAGTKTEAFGGTIAGDGAGGLRVAVDSDVDTTVTHGTNTGTYTAQDSFGRGTMAFGGNTFVYYAVSGENTITKVFRLIVTNTDETDAGTGVRQADTGTTFSVASLTGKFALLAAGNHGGANGADEGFVVAGQINADGTGKLTGFADESEGGTPNDQTSGALTGTYTLASGGTGTLNIVWSTDHHAFGLYPTDPDVNLLDPNSSTDTGGALVLAEDAHIGDGVLVPQSATSMPSGDFGISAHAFTNAGENDAVGDVDIANGSFTGSADVNELFPSSNQVANATVAGTLAADTANPGRFTVPLALTINGTATTESVVVYAISANQFILAQLDPTQFSSGVLEIKTAASGETGGAVVGQKPH